MNRTVWAVLAANLALFIGVTSLPAFQSLHHHWIFPVLAVLLTVEWGIAAGLKNPSAGTTVLSLLAFLILMGVVRHHSILTCIGNCSLKLGSGAGVAAAVFLIHSQRPDRGFWRKERAQAAALASLLWSLYLFLFGQGVPPERLELGVAGMAIILIAVGRRAPQVWLVGAGALWAAAARRVGGEHLIIAADLAMAAAVLWLAGRRDAGR